MARTDYKIQADGSRSARAASALCLAIAIGLIALIAWGYLSRSRQSVATASSPARASPPQQAAMPSPALRSVNSVTPDSREIENLPRQVEAWLGSLDALPSDERDPRIAAILQEIPRQDIGRVVALLQSARETKSLNALREQLVRTWAAADPQAASAWAVQLPPGDLRIAALDQVAVGWANRDPDSAARWAAAMGSASEQQRATLTIGHELVRSEPTEAVRLATALPPDPQRDYLLCRAVMEWANHDATAAIAWVREIPDETLREKALAGALVASAAKDPAAAAELALSELHLSRLQADTLASIAQQWAQKDPEVTAAWVGKLPPGELQQTIANNILAIWDQEIESNR